MECDLPSGQGMPTQFLCHVWFCLVVNGRQWRRLTAACMLTWTRPSPTWVESLGTKRAEKGEFGECVRVIDYIGWKLVMNSLKKLTKARPLRPSVMFSTPLVAPKLCDCNWFFIFGRDCRHRTQIPLIFWEKELIYTFLPYTSSLTKLLCMWQKNNTSPGKSTTNPKLMTHSVVNLVTSQYFTFLSFFPHIVRRNSKICEYFNSSVPYAIN